MKQTDGDPKDRGFKSTLWGSALLGFALGAVAYPIWQPAVETGQVLAGIVRYPGPSPFHLYHLKILSLTNQLSAVLLKLGVSEAFLSVFLGSCVCASNFCAVSMVVWALSGDRRLALAAPLFVEFSGILASSAVYPIAIAGGNSNTFGYLGQSLSLLALGLLGAGAFRAAGFLAALLPSIHASWGGIGFMIMLLSLLWPWRTAAERLRKAMMPVAVGGAVTVGSFLLYLWQSSKVPEVDMERASRLVHAFVAFWDVHRLELTWREVLNLRGLHVGILGAVAAGSWLWLDRNRLADGQRSLLRSYLAALLLSSVGLALLTFPTERLPDNISALMSGRWINLNILGTLPLLIGLLGFQRDRTAPAVLLAFLASAVAYTAPFKVLKLMVLVAAIQPILILLNRNRMEDRASHPAPVARLSYGLALLLLSVVALLQLWGSVRNTSARWVLMRDRTNDPFLRSVAKGEGMLLVGPGIGRVQARTRRPVLLSMRDIDGLPYAPESAVATDRILKEIYGIDLERPPRGKQQKAEGFPPEVIRRVWEDRNPSDWLGIAQRFGVTEVLTARDWRLRLPRTAENGEYALWALGSSLDLILP